MKTMLSLVVCEDLDHSSLDQSSLKAKNVLNHLADDVRGGVVAKGCPTMWPRRGRDSERRRSCNIMLLSSLTMYRLASSRDLNSNC